MTLGYRREDLNYPEKYELYVQMNAGSADSSHGVTALSAQSHDAIASDAHGGSADEVDSDNDSKACKDDSADAKMEVQDGARLDDHGSTEGGQHSRHGKRKTMGGDVTGSGSNGGGANCVDHEDDDDDNRSGKTARVDRDDGNSVASSSAIAATEVTRHELDGGSRTRYK